VHEPERAPLERCLAVLLSADGMSVAVVAQTLGSSPSCVTNCTTVWLAHSMDVVHELVHAGAVPRTGRGRGAAAGGGGAD
jgi:hypothetical protein